MKINPMSTITLDHSSRMNAHALAAGRKSMKPGPARAIRHTLPVPPTTVPDKGRKEAPAALKTDFGTALTTKSTAALTTAGNTLTTAPDVDPVPAPTPQPESYNIEDLVAAWGKSDSIYDFDQNGSVGVSDLLYFINHYLKMTEGSQEGGQTAAPGEVVQVSADEQTKDADELTRDADLPKIADAGDTVDAADVGASPEVTDAPIEGEPVIATAGTLRDALGLTAGSPRSKLAGLNGAAARAALGIAEAPGKSAGHSMGGLKSLADAMFSHLTSSGFATQPPSNIRELIDAMNLAPKQSDFMLKSMAERYPDGLGVNMVA